VIIVLGEDSKIKRLREIVEQERFQLSWGGIKCTKKHWFPF
jgi:hypothetical protein